MNKEEIKRCIEKASAEIIVFTDKRTSLRNELLTMKTGYKIGDTVVYENKKYVIQRSYSGMWWEGQGIKKDGTPKLNLTQLYKLGEKEREL